MLVRGLLEHDRPDLWCVEPGAPAHCRPGAFGESVRFTEVQDQLDASGRTDAFATMRARAVVRPQPIDQSVQLRRPPHGIAPSTERRDAAYRLERGGSDARRLPHGCE